MTNSGSFSLEREPDDVICHDLKDLACHGLELGKRGILAADGLPAEGRPDAGTRIRFSSR